MNGETIIEIGFGVCRISFPESVSRLHFTVSLIEH